MTPVSEFLQEVGFNITRTYGDEIVAYCPWHEDSTASLAINPKNGWHCFAGCGKGRSLQSLLYKFDPTKNHYQRFLDIFPELYIRTLDFSKSKEEEVKPLYDVDELPLAYDNEYLMSRGITNQTVTDFNLKYHEGFNSIVIPIYQRSKFVGSVQRRIVGNPKYVNSAGMNKDQILFPFDKAQSIDNRIILVEGVFDAIKAHQQGVVNVLSSFGGSMSEDHTKMLGSLAKTVVICPDKDLAGIRMAYRSTDLLLKKGLNVEYTFPPGKAKDFGDVDDFSQLKYHSYWKLKILRKSLNTMMERSNA